MPSAPPAGEVAPPDGALPATSLAGLGSRPFGFYLHVPFCATRCGYCDFNTYTAAELGGAGAAPGAARETWADAAIAEVRLARRVLGQTDVPVATVFFGGGTPTLLAPRDLGRVLTVIAGEFGLAPDVEVSTEANPESVDERSLAGLVEQGITRLSLGMQSASPHVLASLERRHTPGRPQRCVAAARAAGFRQVSLDLIYGTPGESTDDWRRSIDEAIAVGPDHVSAYALVVEAGTRLATRVRRGELDAPDEDDLADKYALADDALGASGYSWYEVSNWATGISARCRHNVGYWTGADWWGAGPGAHSHVGGTRWWNVRHPASWAARLAAGQSPAQAREVLDGPTRRVERVLLELRLADGLPLNVLDQAGRKAADRAVLDGMMQAESYALGRAVLTRRGRLLADALVRDLLG